jgi:thioredoxin-related protein
MRAILLTFVCIPLLMAWNLSNTSNSAPSFEFAIGSSVPKPEHKMKDVSGKEYSLKDVQQTNGLLVMFSCNTCPYVIRNQARTREICQWALDKKVGVILINSNENNRGNFDSMEKMQTYAKTQSYKWPYVLDKNNIIADAFLANRTPECFLFDKNGILVYKGAIDDNPGQADQVKVLYLREAMESMLSGNKIKTPTTPSVGCGIKRIANR